MIFCNLFETWLFKLQFFIKNMVDDMLIIYLTSYIEEIKYNIIFFPDDLSHQRTKDETINSDKTYI